MMRSFGPLPVAVVSTTQRSSVESLVNVFAAGSGQGSVQVLLPLGMLSALSAHLACKKSEVLSAADTRTNLSLDPAISANAVIDGGTVMASQSMIGSGAASMSQFVISSGVGMAGTEMIVSQPSGGSIGKLGTLSYAGG